MYSDCGGPTDTYPQLTICERATVATAFLSLPCRLCFQVPIALVLLCRPFADERCCDRRRQHVPAQPIVRDLYELDVRHRLCLVFPPSSRLRHRLCLVCLHRLRGEDTRLCLVCSTVFVAKTMIFCVSTVFVAKPPPLPCVPTAFAPQGTAFALRVPSCLRWLRHCHACPQVWPQDFQLHGTAGADLVSRTTCHRRSLAVRCLSGRTFIIGLRLCAFAPLRLPLPKTLHGSQQ